MEEPRGPEDVPQHSSWQSGAVPPPPAPAGLRLPPPPPVQPAAPAAAVAGEIIFAGRRWQPAGFYPRLGAFLLDFVILSAAFWLLAQAIDMPRLDPSLVFAAQMTLVLEVITGQVIDPSAARIAEEALRMERFRGWLNVLMCCAYFTLFHGLSGASPGKHALGLRVIRRDGRLPGLGWAFARYVGYLAMARLYYSAWLMPFDKEKRTLYDLLLGMNVYKKAR